MGGLLLGLRKLSPILFFFFFFPPPLTPEAPNTRTAEYQAQLCDTLVPQHYWLFWNAYESWWSIFLALRFRSQIRFVPSKFPAGLLSLWCYSGKFIYIKNQIIVYIACLGWFVFYCMYSTSYHAGRLRKIQTEYFHYSQSAQWCL